VASRSVTTQHFCV